MPITRIMKNTQQWKVVSFMMIMMIQLLPISTSAFLGQQPGRLLLKHNSCHDKHCPLARRGHPISRGRCWMATSPSQQEESSLNNSTATTTTTVVVSKRQMLKFAGPALGIYLCNPLLSNIDNAFVGQTVGTRGLAALSPATLCTDEMLYLCSFLSRATTSMVSRCAGRKDNSDNNYNNNTSEVVTPMLTVAGSIGLFLSFFYALATPTMLRLLKVQSDLQPMAASYIYWRGAIPWAALMQSVALATHLAAAAAAATKDAATPLKIIALGALVNIVGDYIFCVFPFQWGTAGAAAATAFATCTTCTMMIRSLLRLQLMRPKQQQQQRPQRPQQRLLLVRPQMPTKAQFQELMAFAGPVLAITVTRLVAFLAMQRTAMKCGVTQLAAYQLTINIVMFFFLFGEPLSQLSQTQLPPLLVKNDNDTTNATTIRKTLQSILILASGTAVCVGSLAAICLYVGAPLFTTDVTVQRIARQAVPSVFCTVAAAVFTVAVEGAMLAGRDFGYLLVVAIGLMILQLSLLSSSWMTSISMIYATFALRLATNAILSLSRIALGFGPMGRYIRRKQKQQLSPNTNLLENYEF